MLSLLCFFMIMCLLSLSRATQTWTIVPESGTPPQPSYTAFSVCDPFGPSCYYFSTEEIDKMYIFDTSTKSWSSVSLLESTPRVSGGCTWIYRESENDSTYIFIYGGSNQNGPKNDMYLFTFDTLAWEAITPPSIVPPPATSSTCAQSATEGYVYGGKSVSGYALPLFWAFNFEKRTWNNVVTAFELEDLPAVYNAKAGLVGDFFVLVGGFDPNLSPVTDVHALNISSGEVFAPENLNTLNQSCFFSLVQLDNSLFFLSAFDSSFQISVRAATLIVTDAMPDTWEWNFFEVTDCFPVLLDASLTFNGSHVMIFGGELIAENVSETVNGLYALDPEAYDSVACAWETLTDPWYTPEDTSYQAAFMLLNSMYVWGGITDNPVSFQRTLYKYTFDYDAIDGGEWSEVSVQCAAPDGRIDFISGTWGTRLVIFGGHDLSQDVFTDLWYFDTVQLLWVELEHSVPQDLKFLLNYCGMVWNGFLFVYGGSSSGYNSNVLYRLDLATLVWESFSLPCMNLEAESRQLENQRNICQDGTVPSLTYCQMLEFDQILYVVGGEDIRTAPFNAVLGLEINMLNSNAPDDALNWYQVPIVADETLDFPTTMLSGYTTASSRDTLYLAFGSVRDIVSKLILQVRLTDYDSFINNTMNATLTILDVAEDVSDSLFDDVSVGSLALTSHHLLFFGGMVSTDGTTRSTIFSNKLYIREITLDPARGNLNCYPGFYFDSTLSECVPCSGGQYGLKPPTGDGQYGACGLCLSGFSNPYEGSPSARFCVPCGNGTYSSSLGSSSCTECPEGTYCPLETAVPLDHRYEMDVTQTQPETLPDNTGIANKISLAIGVLIFLIMAILLVILSCCACATCKTRHAIEMNLKSANAQADLITGMYFRRLLVNSNEEDDESNSHTLSTVTEQTGAYSYTSSMDSYPRDMYARRRHNERSSLIATKRRRKCAFRFNLLDFPFTEQHPQPLYTPMVKRKTNTGGVFTVICIAIMVFIVLSSLVSYFITNEHETQETLLLILAHDKTWAGWSPTNEFQFNATISALLLSYPGQCSEQPFDEVFANCEAGISWTHVNIQHADNATLHCMSLSQMKDDAAFPDSCLIEWTCTNCAVDTIDQHFNISFNIAEGSASASQMQLNASVDTGAGYSSLSVPVSPGDAYLLKGADPTILVATSVPSIVVNRETTTNGTTGFFLSTPELSIGGTVEQDTYAYKNDVNIEFGFKIHIDAIITEFGKDQSFSTLVADCLAELSGISTTLGLVVLFLESFIVLPAVRRCRCCRIRASPQPSITEIIHRYLDMSKEEARKRRLRD
eukprot:gnl/Chilomastix_cuspidata/2943.p1 GENE.gnl/Chilomastix_cuspidata/2943~~gnl/Chilomastix_cuspidata/2943.p1  ORF type:complete len:1304 (+),score=199.81 gnl/Chilomastix_cuspidata/2943:248-4159(+)